MNKLFLLTVWGLSYWTAIRNSKEDIKTMHVQMKWCMAFIGLNILLGMLLEKSWIYSLCGLLPAIILTAANFFNMGKIGTADLYLLTGTGIVLGFWGTVLMLLCSLAAGSVMGMRYLHKHPYMESCNIPFIPVLSFFYIIWIFPLCFTQLIG